AHRPSFSCASRPPRLLHSFPTRRSSDLDDLRFQHALGGIAEQQVGMADDAGVDLRLAIAAACAHRRDAVGELDLAHRAEGFGARSEEHTSELQSLRHLVCRLLLEKKNKT